MGPDISDPAVLEALKAIRTEAHRLEKTSGRQMVSVRSLAVHLGYSEMLPKILRACADGGFDYCLDATIEHDGSFPSRSVCYWGPDQLRSRLDCVDWRLSR